MTVEERNLLFLDNALELPLIKKIKILKSFDLEFDLYNNL